MSDRLVFDIDGEARRFQAELAKMPGWTEATAKKSADAWARAQGKALALSKFQIEDTGKAWTEVGKKVAELAGGPFSRLGQVVFDLVPKSGTAAASLGTLASAATGVGAAVAGVAALAAGTYTLAEAGVAAAQRLRETGHAAEISPEAQASLDAYIETSKELRTEWDVLLVTLGAQAADVIGGVVSVFGDLARGAEELVVSVSGGTRQAESLREGAEALGSTLIDVGSLGVVPLIRYLRDVGHEAAQAEASFDALSAAGLRMAESEIGAEEARRKASAAAGDKQIADAKRTAEQIAKARHAEAVRLAERLAEVERDLQAQIAFSQGENANRALALAEELADGQAEIAEKAAEELRENSENAVKDLAKLIKTTSGQIAAFTRDNAKRAANDWSNLGDAAIDLGDAVTDTFTTAAEKASEAAYDAAIASGKGVKAAEKAAEKASEAQRRAALRVAVAVKAASLAEVTILGVKGIAAAAASAPPPYNIPAIIAATATGAAQVIAVQATPLPQFFGGRASGGGMAPGEQLAVLHRDEPVLNSRTTEALLRLLNERLTPMSAMSAARPDGGGTSGGGTVVLDLHRRRVGRLMRGRGPSEPTPGYTPPRR